MNHLGVTQSRGYAQDSESRLLQLKLFDYKGHRSLGGAIETPTGEQCLQSGCRSRENDCTLTLTKVGNSMFQLS